MSAVGPAAGDEAASDDDLVISILGVRARPSTDAPAVLEVQLATTRGDIEGWLHPCEGSTGCAIFVGGAAGGVDGPADRVYVRLAEALLEHGVTSLRVRYRQPGELLECVLDALAGCSFLKGIGGEGAVLVGHSFGGAVAIKAGGLSPFVRSVIALSSQRFGTQEVEGLGKPLLLIHGADDEVLLPAASEDIYARANEPKRLVILPGAGHGLRESAEEVYGLLHALIRAAVGAALP